MGPRVVILGRGNVATALEEGFRTTDVEVVQLWHRGLQLCQDADLYIIAVKDDAVKEVAALCPTDALVVHTAGSVAMDAIPQKHRGVMYPMQSFTKGRRIDWSRDGLTLYNHIRGLSPYPAAHTLLRSDQGEAVEMKVFTSQFEPCLSSAPIGSVVTDNKNFLKIAINNGYIHLTEVQQAGKKRMSIADFLRGTQFANTWKAEY